MATVKAEVLIRGTIELPATKETDEEMEYTIEQAKEKSRRNFRRYRHQRCRFSL